MSLQLIMTGPPKLVTLDTLEAPWLSPKETDTSITLPSGQTISLLSFPTVEEPKITQNQEQLWWFKDSTTRETRRPQTFNPSQAVSPAMNVLQTVTLGKRIDIGSKVDWTTVGHAVHATMALAFIDPTTRVKIEDVEQILAGYSLSAHVSANSLADQANTVVQWALEQWPNCRTLPEWPVKAALPSGQILNGRIDLLIDAGTHWVLIDHKSNPGSRSSWPELANKYGGQLLSYKEAIELATGKEVKEIWLVLPVSGGAISIESPDEK